MQKGGCKGLWIVRVQAARSDSSNGGAGRVAPTVDRSHSSISDISSGTWSAKIGTREEQDNVSIIRAHPGNRHRMHVRSTARRQDSGSSQGRQPRLDDQRPRSNQHTTKWTRHFQPFQHASKWTRRKQSFQYASKWLKCGPRHGPRRQRKRTCGCRGAR